MGKRPGAPALTWLTQSGKEGRAWRILPTGTSSNYAVGAPLRYSKQLVGSVVCSVIRELTTDTRPTSLELSNPKL